MKVEKSLLGKLPLDIRDHIESIEDDGSTWCVSLKDNNDGESAGDVAFEVMKLAPPDRRVMLIGPEHKPATSSD